MSISTARRSASVSTSERRARTGRLQALAAGVLLAALALPAPSSATSDEALGILKRMSDYLAAQQTLAFAFDSDIEVITPQMEKIQFTNSGEAVLMRPDKFRARRRGGYSEVELVFDGRTASIHGISLGAYAQFEAPGTIDELLTALRVGHGVSMPGADLLMSNAYELLTDDVIEAKHIGHGVIDGRDCDHLAFRNLETDWQIWVEIGDRPVPCKMVITSKTVGGAPQYTVRITGWESGGTIAADAFAFVPPAGAEKLGDEQLILLDELPPEAEPGGSQ